MAARCWALGAVGWTLVTLGVWGGAGTAAWGEDPQPGVDTGALLRRLSAAEARIRELEAERGLRRVSEVIVPRGTDTPDESMSAGVETGPFPVEPDDGEELPGLFEVGNTDQKATPPGEGKSLEARLAELEKQWKALQEADKKKTLSAAGKPTVNLTGQVQVDSIWFRQSELNRQTVGDAQDGVDFRRARIGVFGDIYKNVEYRLEYDFALAGRPSFLDNFINFKETPLQNIKVGFFFEPFGLERITPNRWTTFMERALLDTFTPARRTGVMSWGNTCEDQGTYAVGVFRSQTDSYGGDIGDNAGWAGTGRLTHLLIDEDEGRHLLHVGGATSVRYLASETLRFAQPPEARLISGTSVVQPLFVDTGTFAADSYQLYGLEAAYVCGSLSLQSEYVITQVDGATAAVGDPVFQAAYGYVSYFLTGEHRPYRRNQGVFDRPIPKTNVLKPLNAEGGAPSGCGAWEVAARWSYVDLINDGVSGNRLNDLTIGLNWYLNPYCRLQWNYIHPMLDSRTLGESTADVFAMRAQFDF